MRRPLPKDLAALKWTSMISGTALHGLVNPDESDMPHLAAILLMSSMSSLYTSLMCGLSQALGHRP